MKKFLSVVLAVLVLGTLLSACSKKTDDSADSETKALTEKSQAIVSNVLQSKWDEVRAEGSDIFKSAFTDDVVKKVDPILKEAGAFKSFGESKFTTKQEQVPAGDGKMEDQKFTVNALKVECEKKSFIFTLTYDKDGKLSGLYFK